MQAQNRMHLNLHHMPRTQPLLVARVGLRAWVTSKVSLLPMLLPMLQRLHRPVEVAMEVTAGSVGLLIHLRLRSQAATVVTVATAGKLQQVGQTTNSKAHRLWRVTSLLLEVHRD